MTRGVNSGLLLNNFATHEGAAIISQVVRVQSGCGCHF